MHVDGFRFDLASILSRDSHGHPLPNPPVLWDIESDPALAGTKLIAEAWDAAGLYQVGSFIGDAWKEWNGRFRDDVRDFFRGEPGSVRQACRPPRRQPRGLRSQGARGRAEHQLRHLSRRIHAERSGLLQRKHNEANGEDNRDGANDNRSWNCGVEGPTDDPAIEALRNRQVKNFSRRHAAVAGRADDPDGRRSPAHAAGQQQRLLPGQRDQLVRLVAASRSTPTSTASSSC